MNSETQSSPTLSVWDRPRNTIREFAEAIAAEPGSLSIEVVEQEILNAIWHGVFERPGKCFVSIPEPAHSAHKASEKFIPFTREDLREAAGYWTQTKGTPEQQRRSRFEVMYIDKTHRAPKEEDYQEWCERDPHEGEYQKWRQDTNRTTRAPRSAKLKNVPRYEDLIGQRPETFNRLFQATLSSLLIETDAMSDWLKGPLRSGPGRPSPKSIIELEALRRLKEGEKPTSAREFAEDLHSWFKASPHCKGTIRPVQPPAVGTIENNVRPIMREAGLIIKRK